MNKPRYLIEVTYTSGPHTGKKHLLRKGGYVTDYDNLQFEDTTYKSYGIALAACKKLFARNEQEVEFERNRNNFDISRGKPGKTSFIYEHQVYEPYQVPEDRYAG